MTFSEALNAVRHGKAVTRKVWEKEGKYLKMFEDELYVYESNGFIAAKVKNPDYYSEIDDWYEIDVPESEVIQ